MKFPIPEINASIFSETAILGDAKHNIQFVSNLNNADFSTLSFCNSLIPEKVADLEVGILLVDERMRGVLNEVRSKCVVFCDLPKYHFAKVVSRFLDDGFSGIQGEFDAKISERAYVEEGVVIGEGTSIFPNASVFSSTTIGENCLVQSGSVLGGNGLGDVKYNDEFHRFVHLGQLIIADNVHIGCNVSVLRGMLENTTIGSGTRIANNVNIGHNVIIEEDCYISSGATIGGACTIRRNSWIAPGAILTDHVEVGENTMIGTGAVLIKDAMPNSLYLGNPARRIGERK